MLNKILIIIISFSITGCSSPQSTPEQQNKAIDKVLKPDSTKKSNDTIKKIVVKDELKKQENVSGSVTFSNHYCGGAKPSDEMMEGYRTQYPLKNSTILLKSKNQKDKAIKIKTDKEGNFNMPLDAGTYDYYMTESYNQDMNCSFNSSCKKWLNKCFGQIKIKEGKNSGYTIIFDFECNPCEPRNRP